MEWLAAEGEGGFLDDGGGDGAKTPSGGPARYGCGCATGGAPGIALLPLLALVRRRRPAAA